jgi:cytochrome c-type biogenesis protein CcmH/NrfG
MERLSQEQLAEAKSLLEKSYSQKPESLEFALGLGQACLALKEYSRVREVLVRFLERAKEEPRIYHFLGSAAFFENDPGTAAYYFKKYLAQFGTNLEVLNLLASSLYQTGNREEALAAWRKSLEIAPRQEEIQKKVQELEKR